MSRNTEVTYAYYINGRNIQLYKIGYQGAGENATYQVKIPEFQDQVKLLYPDETIAGGLMFEGTAFIEPFVDIDPNELQNGGMPDVSEVNTPIESSHLNLNRMLSLACVDYVQANLEDRKGDIGKKEYYMKEFYGKLADSESNKRRNIMTFPVNPFALR